MLDINIQPLAWEHFGWWAKNNPKTLLRIHELISISARTPFRLKVLVNLSHLKKILKDTGVEE